MTAPSIVRHPRLILNALRHRQEFRLGWDEAYGDGRTYDEDPWSPRSQAYDTGRDLRRMGRA
jgi:hypothetical protein